MQRKYALRKEEGNFVCMNSQFAAIIKAGDTKFVMKVSVYHTQIDLILQFLCLARSHQKTVNCNYQAKY